MYAGIVIVKALDGAGANEIYRRVAFAVEAGPFGVGAVRAVDRRIGDGHGRAGLDVELAQRAARQGFVERHAVECRPAVARRLGEVAVPADGARLAGRRVCERRAHAIHCNRAAGAAIARADRTGGIVSACGHDACDAGADGDGAASLAATAADAGAVAAADRRDDAALDVEVTTGLARAAADARAVDARREERSGAAAVNGQRLARRDVDAWEILVEPVGHVVAGEGDRGVAFARKTGPRAVDVVHAADNGVGKRHRCTGGNGDLILAGKRAVDHRAVDGFHVAREDGEIAVPRDRARSAVGARLVLHAAVQRHVAAGAVIARADRTDGIFAAPGPDLGDARRDMDAAAGSLVAAADAGGTGFAIRINEAALDVDVAAGELVAAADAGAPVIAVGVERAAALDRQRLVRRDVDAGIIHVEALDPVHALKYERRVALAGEAGPQAVRVAAVEDDVDRPEGHRRAVGDGHLGLVGHCTEDGHAVVRGHVRIRVQLGEVAVPVRHDGTRSVARGVGHAARLRDAPRLDRADVAAPPETEDG